ncbi:MarR family transcriptional regulator [Microbulbifer sp. A4B17]|uniref:MarR family winged helix-turn-helix transcriptional regulator n=1 Tax=Microbulbifer sp. A4B17 TaxID=359370 RepID=UPI000D52D12A|nr:MarR family transcriptional regulator [Microbulbifer sp. A4B17]AWF82510.1 MarR family transcriptional regulator [Microbulbifer sp. A4B17]
MKYSQLGTQLRYLLELLDGDVAESYNLCGLESYKPRYTPIIRALLHKRDITISEVVASTHISQPAVSQTVKGMIKQGLVQASSGEDARQRKIRLTRKGRALIPKLKQQWLATVEAEHSLSAELSVPLSEILNEAIQALKERPYLERIQKNLPAEAIQT